MDTISTRNSKNCKTSDSHRLSLNPTDKINLKIVMNMFLYQILAYAIHEKYKKVIREK